MASNLHQTLGSLALAFNAVACVPFCNAQIQPSPYQFSQIYTCITSQPPGPTSGPCDIVSYHQEAYNSLVTLNTTYIPSTPQVQMYVNNLADARYGIMRAVASNTFQVGSVPLLVNSTSISEFEDILTVSSAPWNGQTGYMQIQYTLNGNVTTSGKSEGLGSFACYVDAGGDFQEDVVQDRAGSINGLFAFPTVFHFTYGQPFYLGCFLGVAAGSSDALGALALVTGSGSAIADFANTALISGFEFTDANGNPAAVSPTITASSGTPYSAMGVLTTFKNLDIREAEVRRRRDGDDVRLQGTFEIASNGSAFDPLTQDFAVQIGAFSRIIPAGSFRRAEDRAESYFFDGTVNGVMVHARIKQLAENWFTFDIKIPGPTLTPTASRLNVRLIAGMNGGITTAMVDTE